ncbi:MAG: lysine 2,3-aminomutase [Rhodospirillales bacterium]|nr:lysine 2,3-aminomutase [Rhodospirillales bacterium]
MFSQDHTRLGGISQEGTLRTVRALEEAGLTSPFEREALNHVAERYAIAVTSHIADLIDPQDINDPIARQFVPSAGELAIAPDELTDPIGDETHSPVKGIVHRYPDRVLLKALHACPVYCRFCFRREQVGPGGAVLSEDELDMAIAYIRSNPAIWEVILTGGDPLMLSPRRLGRILDALDAIPHVATLRIHSRVPIAEPARIGPALLAVLARRKPLWIAIHANHPRELTDAARAACRRLTQTGATLLGQTVLLRGVNDDPTTLETLFRAMVMERIKPYYLHHPDLAPGTAHFRLPIARGQAIMRALRGRLSGLAQPTYVLDIPGGAGKVPIGPNMVEAGGVRDSADQLHSYGQLSD